MTKRFKTTRVSKEFISRDIVQFGFAASMDDFRFTLGQHIQLIAPTIYDSHKLEGI